MPLASQVRASLMSLLPDLYELITISNNTNPFEAVLAIQEASAYEIYLYLKTKFCKTKPVEIQ